MTRLDQANTHIFALYCDGLSAIIKNIPDIVEITDQDLIHRMQKVIRLAEGDHCILFDRLIHAFIVVKSYSKKTVLIELKGSKPNKQHKPYIRFLLPMLKREHLDEALYSLTEMGVNQIDLIITAKSRHEKIDERIHDRMMRVIIAACEQSKNYAIPDLKGPSRLQDIFSSLSQDSTFLFFDPSGMKAQDWISKINTHEKINILIGPEGDLTEDEKLLLKQKKCMFCSLTPTILRAHQAASLGIGILRSFNSE